MNRQGAPVQSCFAGPALPALNRAGKNAKGRRQEKSFALRGLPQGKNLPSLSWMPQYCSSIALFLALWQEHSLQPKAKPCALLFTQQDTIFSSWRPWRLGGNY
jgi:hypothetical protein